MQQQRMASHGWQPQEEGVKEICGLLHESKVPSVDQSLVLQQLQRCNRFPDFNNYLTFILCRAEVLKFSPTHLMFSLVGSPPPTQPAHNTHNVSRVHLMMWYTCSGCLCICRDCVACMYALQSTRRMFLHHGSVAHCSPGFVFLHWNLALCHGRFSQA